MIELALGGLLAMQRATENPVTLGDIRMHLFYAETGRLSPDISPPNRFTGWNTIIGEGDAQENADDLAIVVELRANGSLNIETPLVVTARDSRGRVLGQRRFTGSLIGENGRAYRVLYLPDATCAGTIRVSASFGRQTRNESVALNCGE